ncbi:hypothetical protein OG782_18410 [Streptomyces sp. NBC_00876]|uniref:anti-sigma factor family protein n=1 Tax=Streptomyces sp. NBC_00876 TaxID=2975853 RepID=UPI0038634D61|nr:hypothetical protein OG782_18410 [Streptomyces sp. NBC_00876]
MTSSTDTTQHPDVSEISDLTEGLLSPSRTADVRRHIADCELCADVHASLEEISALLGTMPAPQRMPADIADRIDAALADEVRSASAALDAAADVSRETGPDSTVHDLADRPAGHSRAATGPGRRPARRRRRASVLAAALGAAAVVGASVFLLQNIQLSQGSDDASAMDRSASGTAKTHSQAFSPSTLEDQVQSLLSPRADAASPQEAGGQEEAPSADKKSSPGITSPDSASPQTPLRAPSVTVPPCVEQGIGRNTAALAIEKGTYEGANAFLVVLPHPTDSTKVQAYVVDAACIGAEPAAKGELLLTHTYARP